eukprot:UN00412
MLKCNGVLLKLLSILISIFSIQSRSLATLDNPFRAAICNAV